MPYKDPAKRKAYSKMYFLSNRKVYGGLREAKMFRRDFLVREVAALCELTLPKARKVVNAILSSMRDSLKRGEEVSVPGFGKFLIHSRPKNVYGYPVYFVPSKQLVYLVKHPNYGRESV